MDDPVPRSCSDILLVLFGGFPVSFFHFSNVESLLDKLDFYLLLFHEVWQHTKKPGLFQKALG
jgi:hypothetical protein